MEWKRGPAIGRGSSATVYLASEISGVEVFAVKSCDLSSSGSLRREERLISELCSPYVVRCLGSGVTEGGAGGIGEFNLFLEYVAGGTLSDLVRNRGGSLDEKTIQLYANQLAIGLDHIHGKGIVHCDIKGQNILIGKEALKICDFGCGKKAGRGGEPPIVGTPAYMSPEVARGEEQSFPADIWALGCTVIEMATGSNPWPEMNHPVSALFRVAHSGDTPAPPDWLSNAAKDFIGKCLARDPRQRWTAAELLRHPFLEENCGAFRGPTRESPTSVMDQTFWDSVEEPEDSAETPSPAPAPAPAADSPANRITALIGTSPPNWSDDGSWTRVRGIEEEHSQECSSRHEIEPPSAAAVAVEEEEEEEEEASFFNDYSFNEFQNSSIIKNLIEIYYGDHAIKSNANNNNKI
ncbi:hypothetical protein M569_11769 [Genlisea aurea]|uniref:Protein kinase domain-containing protein n=1 Tax=Genlisea aurea TaxID=192259 RepID=S8CES9_9LAMI|nr:hypothetical protein M569_11769 [Genlisea aurea]